MGMKLSVVSRGDKFQRTHRGSVVSLPRLGLISPLDYRKMIMNRESIDALLFIYFAEEGRKFSDSSDAITWVNAENIPLSKTGLAELSEFDYITPFFVGEVEYYSLTDKGREFAAQNIEEIYNEQEDA